MAKLTHAILIEGGSEAERYEKAISMLKEHFSDDQRAAEKLDSGGFEDLIVLTPLPDKKDVVVNQIEDLMGLLKQKPLASTGKACLIPAGERLSETVQNKLLKVLEEPVPGDVIIIMAANAEGLLATVRSRCVRIWLGYPAAGSAAVTEDIKKLATILIYGKGGFAEASRILAPYEDSKAEDAREAAADFVRAFQLFLRNLAVGRLAADLTDDGTEDGRWFRETAAKVGKKHAAGMQDGVLVAEKTLRSIERGDRVHGALRGMALTMLTERRV